MGCDIHLGFEVRDESGVWKELEIDERLFPDDRYYKLFYFLAGIRGTEDDKFEPLAPNRGIPEDSSFFEDFKDDWRFGRTHIYLDEAITANWKEAGMEDCYFKIFCEYVLPRLVSSVGYINRLDQRNYRINMCFDN